MLTWHALIAVIAPVSMLLVNPTEAQRRPAQSTSANATVTYLGALSYRDTAATSRSTSRGAPVTLRALFCTSTRGWLSTQSSGNAKSPCTVREIDRWSIVRDAHVIGAVNTMHVSTVQSDTVHIASALSALPRIPAASFEFESWLGAVQFRPLAVVSAATVRDPEGWTTTTLTANELSRARAAFRSRVTLPPCDSKLSRGTYAMRDLRVGHALRSKSGSLMVSLAINESLHPCDDIRDPARTVHWFVQQNATTFRFIGNEMQLVEIADFDADGASEWLFSISRYNEDGFVLISNAGRRSVRTRWHYH